MFLSNVRNIVYMALPNAVSSAVVMAAINLNTRIVAFNNKNILYFLAFFMPINYLLVALFQTFSVCSMVLASDKDKNPSEVSSSIIYLLSIAVLIFLIVALGIYLTSGYFLNRSQLHYFIILMIIANIPVCINIITNSALYGLGKYYLSFFLTVMASTINSYLLYFICTNFNCGFLELPYSIFVTYSTITTVILLYLLKYKHLTLRNIFLNFKNVVYVYKVMKHIGVPVFFINAVIFISLFIMIHIFSSFGKDVVAGFCIAFRIQVLVLVPAMSFGIAAGLLINKYVAQNKVNYALKSLKDVLIFSFLIYLGISFLVHTFSSDIIKLITNDFNIQQQAIECLNYLSISYLGFGPVLTFLCVLEQTGYGSKSLFLNILVTSLQIILGLILSKHYHTITMFYEVIVLIDLCFLIVILLEIIFNKSYINNISRIRTYISLTS